MSKVAWLFPGQGSQAVGMGVALAEAEPAARAVLQADGAHSASHPHPQRHGRQGLGAPSPET